MSINYSIAMLGNPIDEDAPKKAYAKSQYTNILTLDKFAGHIASHGSKYNRADIYAVLMQTVDCMREMLLEGKRIEMGDPVSYTHLDVYKRKTVHRFNFFL